jgi:hypothetical protein
MLRQASRWAIELRRQNCISLECNAIHVNAQFALDTPIAFAGRPRRSQSILELRKYSITIMIRYQKHYDLSSPMSDERFRRIASLCVCVCVCVCHSQPIQLI